MLFQAEAGYRNDVGICTCSKACTHTICFFCYVFGAKFAASFCKKFSHNGCQPCLFTVNEGSSLNQETEGYYWLFLVFDKKQLQTVFQNLLAVFRKFKFY